MIKYNLKCHNDHEFESWFSDSKEFENLNSKNLLECIFCSSKKINKSIMATSISKLKKEFEQSKDVNEFLKDEKRNFTIKKIY